MVVGLHVACAESLGAFTTLTIICAFDLGEAARCPTDTILLDDFIKKGHIVFIILLLLLLFLFVRLLFLFLVLPLIALTLIAVGLGIG